jgi:amino acid transporter
MMSRRVQKAIIISFLVVGVALIAGNFYFYYFYSAQIVDHSLPATGNIYPVAMNGRMIFLTRFQNDFVEATWCGSLLVFAVGSCLSDRWKLGTPRSII